MFAHQETHAINSAQEIEIKSECPISELREEIKSSLEGIPCDYNECENEATTEVIVGKLEFQGGSDYYVCDRHINDSLELYEKEHF